MADASLHIIVSGRVQGVGFRYYVARAAERRGIAGWVRNLPDGKVEIEAHGPRPHLEEFLRDVGAGPRMAHVAGLDTVWGEGRAGGAGFSIV